MRLSAVVPAACQTAMNFPARRAIYLLVDPKRPGRAIAPLVKFFMMAVNDKVPHYVAATFFVRVMRLSGITCLCSCYFELRVSCFAILRG